MRRFRFALQALLSSLLIVPASAQYPRAWNSFRDLGQSSSETPVRMIAAPGGGTYMFGVQSGSSTVCLVDDTGALIWSRCAPGVNGDVAAGSSGVAMTGYISRWTYYQFYDLFSVQKYNPQGALLWSRLLSAMPDSASGKVALDPAGNVIVAETASGDTTLRKFDAATGALLFTVAVPSTSLDSFNGSFGDLQCDGSGAIYLEGSYNGSATQFGVVTKYDASGSVLWSKPYANETIGMALAPNGKELVCYQAYNGISETGVQELDSSGNELWTTVVPQPFRIGTMAVSPSGALLLAGTPGYPTAVTLVDPTGAVKWTKQFGAYGGGLAFDSSNYAYVAYASNFSTSALTKMDLSGNTIWTATTPSGAPGYAKGLTFDKLGRPVQFLAANNALTYMDLEASTYTTDGSLLWTQDVDAHRSYDTAANSVTDSGGSTYVGGYSFGGKKLVALARFSISGGVYWSRNLPSLQNSGATLVGPVLAPNGVVVGQNLLQSSAPEPGVFGVFRYDSSGNVLWSYTDSGNGQDLRDIKVASDGSVYLAIIKTTFSNNYYNENMRVVKLSASGSIAWIADGPVQVDALSGTPHIILDQAGSSYVSFTVISMNGVHQAAALRVNSSGAVVWSNVVPEAGGAADQAHGVAVDSAGNCYLLAKIYSYSSSTNNGEWVFKYDPLGNPVGSRSVPTSYDTEVIAADAHDNLFVAGYPAMWNLGNGPLVQKISPNGSSDWVHYFNIQHWENRTIRLIPDQKGGAFIAVRSNNRPSSAYWVAGLGSDGTPTWPATGGLFQSGAIIQSADPNDYALGGLGIDWFGNLYASGSAYGPSGTVDFNLVKFYANDSSPVSQVVPSSMVAGQTYSVSSTFQNTGFESWTSAAGYKLGLINGGSTWGLTSVALGSSESIAPGQSRKFIGNVYAPTVPGVYSFQTKMYKSGTSFGALSPAHSVTVYQAADAARYVSQTEPTTVAAGAMFTVKVDERNVGSNTWTQAGGYALAPVPGYPSWNVAQVPLAAADSISTGLDKIFLFNAQAPTTPGSYTMRFQMERGTVFFGDRTFTKTITVTP